MWPMTPWPTRPDALVVLSLSLMMGCGDGVQSSPRAACDPRNDEGCGGGERCRLDAVGGTLCLAQVAGVIGDGCDSASCPPGQSCLTFAGATRCRPVCDRSADDCDAGVCAVEVSGSAWGACLEHCAIATGCTDAAEACAPVQGLAAPACIPAGPSGPGAACQPGDCALGGACLERAGERLCVPICDPADARCPPGYFCAGPVQGVAGVSYCVE